MTIELLTSLLSIILVAIVLVIVIGIFMSFGLYFAMAGLAGIMFFLTVSIGSFFISGNVSNWMDVGLVSSFILAFLSVLCYNPDF